jgi:glycyl-tRNA synthetase
MLEVDTTIITLSEVLKTSGHVDKFTDFMTSDLVTKEIFRADHLIEGVLEGRLEGDKKLRETESGAQPVDAIPVTTKDEKVKKKKPTAKNAVAKKLTEEERVEYEEVLAKIDNYGGDEMESLIRKYEIKSPEGNELSKPVEFNLMFENKIGPTGLVKG